jgi:hypothetical protein
VKSFTAIQPWLFASLCVAAFTAAAGPGQTLEEARNHWAFQPLLTNAVPKVHSRARVQSPVDAFLLAKLEKLGLGFAPPADKRTLLRRTYFDLIGLPPTFEEIQSFEQDRSRAAFARVVEKLLASPCYGECWGRHWLDVARYADTKDLVLAYGKDALRPYAYTYRDYVIRAFNEDLPFDQFIADQLAADLAGPDLPKWRLAAMGFLTLGRLFDNNPHDQIDDQIDTTTRGFLGLTVACARCHDHKYDAISQRDYYGLYGVFASSQRPYDLPLLEDPKQVPGGVEFEAQFGRARKELEDHIDAEFAKLTEIFRRRIGDYLVRAGTTPPDLSETTQFALSLVPDDYRPGLVQRTRRMLERRVDPQDRVFGPWAVLFALPDAEFASSAQATLEKLRERSTSRGGTSTNNLNPLVLDALAKAAITNKAAVARAYGQAMLEVYDESLKPAAGSPGLTADQAELLKLVTSTESPIWFPRRDTPDHMSRPDKDRFNSLVSNLDKIAANATNAPPARAMVLADLSEPVQPHIFKRGNPSRPGEEVPRAFPAVLTGGLARPFSNGGGRMDLARAIVGPGRALAARVFVNRVWMLHFGDPLAVSTTDFGARSSKPENAELLDWLAGEFIRSNWSVKHLHRLMLLSSAYQQSSSTSASRGKISAGTQQGINGQSPEGDQAASRVSAAGSAGDPENKFLWHYPRHRLDFEAMRDSLLLVSGRLDSTMGGRSVELANDPFSRRRSVYGLIDRQDLPAVLRAFDFPAPDQCLERRPRTSVPQQALFALNSPFVMELARALAALPEIASESKLKQRVDMLFLRVYGRHATKEQTSSALAFVAAASAAPQPQGCLAPWEQLAQVLLISNESVFLD